VTYLLLPDMRNGYVKLIDHVLTHGDKIAVRGLVTTELTGVTYEVPDPTGVMLPIGVGRRVNSKLAAVEALQLMSGTDDVDLLLKASPGYADVLVKPEHAGYGAYGPRLRFQLDALYEELYAYPHTRRAVLAIWREDDLTHDGDRPCTLSLQFLIRDDELELIVTMRSQDVWLGTPYDAFMFSQLQWSLANQLGVNVGRYVQHVGSIHVYERDLDRIAELRLCPDDRPTPVDYPRGLRTIFDGNYLTELAASLVKGEANVHDVDDNPWYVRQLAELDVIQEVT
jgi:thymidylate synthase